ncbi:glycosyltransferase [Membranihabitans marinus]|uniref:glycosyltransferase n=1 Tax=Membranihabitans marinus TaxID=1227546 RepID=UPI001F168366|nr:glycosyltransferase [Membranihabitans marinus]
MSIKSTKTVLFHYSIFNTGGAERSTAKLMKALCDRGWQVTLLLNAGGGDFESFIDPRVNIIHLKPKPYGNKFKSAKTLIEKIKYTFDAFLYLYSKIIEKFRLRQLRHIHFQAAIVSLQGLSPKIVTQHIKCNVRIHMIRNDISKIHNPEKIAQSIGQYHDEIDYYVCVAQESKAALIRQFPMLEEKALVIHNLLNSDKMLAAIKNQANPYLSYGNLTKIVSVGRLSDSAKGLIRMAEVHAALLEKGYNHLWFLVGEGKDRALITEKIKSLGIEKSFILLGPQSNPYPFYYYADISATLSQYEGLCGAVNEAKVMGRPVIATEFSGIHEQITDGVNGLIVENNKEAIIEGLRKLLIDQTLIKQLTNDILPAIIKDDNLKINRLEQIIENHE